MPPFLPLASILPGAGVSIGVNLATEVLPNTLESASVGIDLIQNIQVPITSAEILALASTPLLLVPAPPAGKANVLYRAVLRTAPGGTAYTGGGNVLVQYGTSGAACINAIADTVIQSASAETVVRQGIDVTAVINAALYLSAAMAFAAGNGTAMIELWYSVY